MAAGYGNDVTASNSDPGTGSDIAGAIAQIFSTGVTAYVDSQAIQSGYQINDPRYFQAGYPAGVSNVYSPTAAGASVSVAGSNTKLLLLGLLLLGAYLVLKR